jgi:hypothetical protein
MAESNSAGDAPAPVSETAVQQAPQCRAADVILRHTVGFHMESVRSKLGVMVSYQGSAIVG